MFYKLSIRIGAVKVFFKMTSLLNREIVKRGRGRPPARSVAVARRALIEAAAVEFLVNGYAVTCMGTVARRAGFSTRTLYELVPTKAALFEMVVDDRSAGFSLAISDGVWDGRRADLPPRETLTRILIAYGNFALSQETIDATKLVIAEGARFPEVAAAFQEKALDRIGGLIECWLGDQVGLGNLALENPRAASEALRAMMIMEPQRAVLIGRSGVPSAEEIAQRAATCADLFLNGCLIAASAAA